MSRAAAVVEGVTIDAAAHDGRGIARLDGKVVFVEGALPGERADIRVRRRRRGYDEGQLVELIEASPRRVIPRCAHFGTCGGCAMQHMDITAQLEVKRAALRDALARTGRVTPARELEPVSGPAWHYRRRARLSCRLVEKKGRVLVGFRERGRPLVADLEACEVLALPAGRLVKPLAELIGTLDRARDIPQVEVAVADNACVLVLRHMQPLTDGDTAALRRFAAEHGIEFHLQPGGPDSTAPLDPPGSELVYAVDGIELAFTPTGFVQVNGEVNRKLVALAIESIEAGPGHDVLDLYCGLGNFSLPLARRARNVCGVEGDTSLVGLARANATRNRIGNAEFIVADLSADNADASWARREWDRVLLDPPRTGAQEAVALMPALSPERIVYVSCHPGTLARDAATLVHGQGYRLVAAGIIDMFPHTTHVESIAVFER